MAGRKHKKHRKRKNKISDPKVRSSVKSKPKKSWIIPLLIVIAISFLVLSPSLKNDFVNWDDDRNFYENPLITSINSNNFWENTKLIFQTPVIGNYNPLTIFSFALEKMTYGLENPFYWHLDNLVLHLLCIWFVYLLGTALGLNWSGAGILALLFGIHPMRVESVAWVTERKDVLFGLFYLIALYFYVLYQKRQRNKRYLLFIYTFFILSLFSKIQAVALPLSMLAIDYYIGRPIKWKLILEKAPYFLLSIGFGILGIVMLHGQGSLESNTTYPIYVRPFVGSYSLLVYLIKSVIPYILSPLYPYPNSPPWYIFASVICIPFYVWGFWHAWKNKNKVIVFGLSFFFFNIVFLLQILGAGQGFLADRFTYIAYFGLFFIIAWYMQKALSHYSKQKFAVYTSFTVIFGVYSFISYNQTKIWKNSGTLWTHVIKYFDNTTLPFGNRANYYRDSGQDQKALADYSEAIRLNPNKAAPFNSRAKLYFNSNHPDTLSLALSDYNRAIALDPENGEYYVNRGAIYARTHQLQKALDDFNLGIQLSPDHAVGYLNRSVTYNMLGRYESSIADMDKYLQYHPNSPDIFFEKGRAKFRLNRREEALRDFNQAILLNPNKGIYYYERSILHSQIGNIAQAKTDIQNAVQLGVQVDPEYARNLNQQ